MKRERRCVSDSEGDSGGLSEQAESRDLGSDSELEPLAEKGKAEGTSVAMFLKLSEWRMSLLKLSINSSKILVGESHCRIRTDS